MSNWERVDAREFLSDVNKAANEAFRLQPHSFKARRRIPYLVCQGCGLVLLRNRRTAWAEKHGCLYQRHPGFPANMRGLS